MGEETEERGKAGERFLTCQGAIKSFIYFFIISSVVFKVQCLTSKGSLGGSYSKESACSVGDPRSIPGLGRSPGEENGNPL